MRKIRQIITQIRKKVSKFILAFVITFMLILPSLSVALPIKLSWEKSFVLNKVANSMITLSPTDEYLIFEIKSGEIIASYALSSANATYNGVPTRFSGFLTNTNTFYFNVLYFVKGKVILEVKYFDFSSSSEKTSINVTNIAIALLSVVAIAFTYKKKRN